MLRAYRFRLYPNRLQEEALRHHLWLSKELWNRMLDYSKSKYKREGKFASKKELREIVKRQGLFSQVAQELVDRLVDATWRFVRMKKTGEDCGFPRFKSFERMKSLLSPDGVPNSGQLFEGGAFRRNQAEASSPSQRESEDSCFEA